MSKTVERENILNDTEVFLKYLNSKIPMFHNSNIFMRDIEYGVQSYLEKKEDKISFGEAKIIAQKIVANLESKNIFKKVKEDTWKLQNPDFITQKPGDPL